ncbi:hypothetical protein, partial [Burkholderia ubonensis]|uniref:hypothetical protein n=1 Tax=Burkholderia ubonensis TaxID=101571 RepID=UPI001C42F1C3
MDIALNVSMLPVVKQREKRACDGAVVGKLRRTCRHFAAIPPIGGSVQVRTAGFRSYLTVAFRPAQSVQPANAFDIFLGHFS